MTKQEKFNAIREFNIRIRDEQTKGSTGYIGKQVDFWVRDSIMVHGVSSVADVRCRRAGADDWCIRINGKLYRGETKTNMGEWKVPCARICADDIFPKADYVAFTAEVEGLTAENVADNVFVFTREQFIEMLTMTGRKGLESSLRYNAKRGTVGIQAWKLYSNQTGKWVEARLNKYYDYLEANAIPTIAEFLEMVRG
jgi:hypothetical protein